MISVDYLNVDDMRKVEQQVRVMIAQNNVCFVDDDDEEFVVVPIEEWRRIVYEVEKKLLELE